MAASTKVGWTGLLLLAALVVFGVYAYVRVQHRRELAAGRERPAPTAMRAGRDQPPASSGPGGSESLRGRPNTFEYGGTERTSQTLPPMTEPRPMTVSPPRIVAPA